MAQPVELYVTKSCPFCAAAREDLEWRGADFVEYDVDADPDARERMLTLTGGSKTVPVIVEDGRPITIGWEGRGCAI